VARAVFLDRDGVINALVHNPETGENESPLRTGQLLILPGVVRALCKLRKAGFRLFVVSNQPSFAKGKMTMKETRAIASAVRQALRSGGAKVTRYYYCYHHPEGIVSAYRRKCRCRKPGTYFLLKAARTYGVDLRTSWMVGDHARDILCGKRSGTKTLLVMNPMSARFRRGAKPDRRAVDLLRAAAIIIKDVQGGGRWG
jgi:D-glycero-D-manno-heptose 1,7-bisphosphate phosphatase